MTPFPHFSSPTSIHILDQRQTPYFSLPFTWDRKELQNEVQLNNLPTHNNGVNFCNLPAPRKIRTVIPSYPSPSDLEEVCSSKRKLGMTKAYFTYRLCFWGFKKCFNAKKSEDNYNKK